MQNLEKDGHVFSAINIANISQRHGELMEIHDELCYVFLLSVVVNLHDWLAVGHTL